MKIDITKKAYTPYTKIEIEHNGVKFESEILDYKEVRELRDIFYDAFQTLDKIIEDSEVIK